MKWEAEVIEQVEKYNYNGFLMSDSNMDNAQIAKANALLGNTWSKGQR